MTRGNIPAQDEIRQTWLKGVQADIGYCLVVAGTAPAAPTRSDVLGLSLHGGEILPNLHIKVYEWLHQASNANASYVAKTDDDIYIQVPKLVETLRSQVPGSNAYFGRMLYVGYEKTKAKSCGYSFTMGGAWRKHRTYKCDVNNFSTPFAFSIGMLYVLTHDVGKRLDHRLFYENRPIIKGEDVLVGYAVRQMEGVRLVQNTMLDMSCTKKTGFDAPIHTSRNHLAFHGLKQRGSLHYVHRFLHGNATYNARE